MPSYGSLQSPSLRKMEARGYGSRRKGIQMGNILGDPFALATISISVLVWFVAFISLIIAKVQTPPNGRPPNEFAWWAGIYSLALIIGVFVVVASDTIHTYHVALTGYCAAGIVLTSSSVNSFIYESGSPARQASAAGFILLAMVQVCSDYPSRE
jgi:SHO1 osmosensor